MDGHNEETAPKDLHGLRHGQEMRELAFTLYIKADRNLKRTLELLDEECRGMLGEDGKPVVTPNYRTLLRWKGAEDWDALADRAIAEAFPHLHMRNLARLMNLQGEALSQYADVLSGNLDDLKPGALQARVAVAKDLLWLSGLGTAGSRADGSSITPKTVVQESIDSGLTPQEIARRQRERLEDGKEDR